MFAVLNALSHSLLRAAGARSSQLDTPVGKVHAYELEGRGEGTFVLLHGMGTTATTYTPVARKLKAHARRVVMIDLPGHGRSEELGLTLDAERLGVGVRDALDGLIEATDPAVVLGTSLGGAAALGYALERPDRVRALVLASPAGAPLTDDDVEALRARFDLKTRADARRFFSELLHRPPFYLRALERGLVEQLTRPVVRGFLESLQAEQFFSEERVGKLVPPATVLWGKSDQILPRSGLDFYRRALPPGTRFEELDAIGHSPHLEQPNLVVDRILAAYERARRPASTA